jgi:hypothetical protein
MYESDSPIMVDSSDSSSASYIMAILLGIIGAGIGGAIWAGVAIVTDYEIGLLAILVGALAGLGVHFGSGKVGGMPYQIVAVVLATLGIMIGKYIMVYHFAQLEIISQFGQEAWDMLGYSPLSGDYFELFMEILPETLEIFDAIFFGIAVYTAWGIPKQEMAMVTGDKIKNDEVVDFE